jgi:hypothetical protein
MFWPNLCQNHLVFNIEDNNTLRLIQVQYVKFDEKASMTPFTDSPACSSGALGTQCEYFPTFALFSSYWSFKRLFGIFRQCVRLHIKELKLGRDGSLSLLLFDFRTRIWTILHFSWI